MLSSTASEVGPERMARPAKHGQKMAQVIEYIPDHLYLAAYSRPPNPGDGIFPGKRMQRTDDGDCPAPCYFTVDDSLLYNAFHDDFGPLHIGHLYRFALRFHQVYHEGGNKHRPVVFWSAADARSRANAACLLACYMVLIQSWPPHLALAPIAQVDPPLMPFRDAGYSQADYGISVQDVVYGVWRAKEEKCCDVEKFNLDMYERFERVENGDFNWITPQFLAFASPSHGPVDKVAEGSAAHAALPRDTGAIMAHATLPQPFRNILCHFLDSKVGLVVRLNSPLYSASYFEALGIHHVDMMFDDGTCPPLTTVRKFIRLAHETMTVRKKAIAVHCKAGLGRTGCLIGAYLIYRHGFTANEVIAYMRFMRPGMVVGPQQHWLHINQGTFREWWVEERVERRLRREGAARLAPRAPGAPSTPVRALHKKPPRTGQTSTPPNPGRTPLGEMDHERTANVGPQDDCLPAPTPGQPRKTSRHHPYQRSLSHAKTPAEQRDSGLDHDTPVAAVHGPSHGLDADEQVHIHVRSYRSSAQSAARTDVCSTSAALLFENNNNNNNNNNSNDSSRDAENLSPTRVRQVDHVATASSTAVLTKVRGSGGRRDGAGVRKSSARTASSATAVSAARKASAS